jgi:hypothetical protein
VQAEADYIIEGDASLEGLAVGIRSYNRDEPDDTGGLIAFTTFHPLPFTLSTDSSKQNTFEYITVLMGLALARHLGFKEFGYHVIGDSMNTLSWCEKQRANSFLARRASVAYALLATDIKADICGTTHLAGVDNVIYDGLSRGLTPEQVGIDPAKSVKFEPGTWVHKYLVECDPDLPLASKQDHLNMYSSLVSILKQSV